MLINGAIQLPVGLPSLWPRNEFASGRGDSDANNLNIETACRDTRWQAVARSVTGLP